VQPGEPPNQLRDALTVVERLSSGTPPDSDSIANVATAFETLIELYEADGALDKKAEASAMLATALRIGAGLTDGDSRQSSLRRAYQHALKACDHAVEAATKDAVNNVNLAAYVRALDEAAQTALALGEADLSAAGTRLLAEAAKNFGEAAAGYRRLGRNGDAKAAEMKSLAARANAALRG
jgi:hypothetical protein